MKLLKRKNGQIFIYITFFIVAVLIIIIAAVLVPFGVSFSTRMYEAGEDIYLDLNESVDIQDAEVRASVTDGIESGLDALETNIDVSQDIFRYSWVIVIILTALVMFIFTRRIVETQGGVI